MGGKGRLDTGWAVGTKAANRDSRISTACMSIADAMQLLCEIELGEGVAAASKPGEPHRESS